MQRICLAAILHYTCTNSIVWYEFQPRFYQGAGQSFGCDVAPSLLPVLLLKMLLKCADLGHLAERESVHAEWVRALIASANPKKLAERGVQKEGRATRGARGERSAQREGRATRGSPRVGTDQFAKFAYTFGWAAEGGQGPIARKHPWH